MKPIAMDIETSGIDPVKCGVWQIGAYDMNTGEEFLGEAKIDDEDQVLNDKNANKTVFEVTGKTEEVLRDKNKQSQKDLIQKFLQWVKTRSSLNFLCQNPQFDISRIVIKADKYGFNIPFHFRAFDLHSIAQEKYYEIHKNFLIKGNISDMGLKNILKFCGIEDKRKSHNALEDAKLTAECFSRIIYGKGLFEEYSGYKIPEKLKR